MARSEREKLFHPRLFSSVFLRISTLLLVWSWRNKMDEKRDIGFCLALLTRQVTERSPQSVNVRPISHGKDNTWRSFLCRSNENVFSKHNRDFVATKFLNKKNNFFLRFNCTKIKKIVGLFWYYFWLFDFINDKSPNFFPWIKKILNL